MKQFNYRVFPGDTVNKPKDVGGWRFNDVSSVRNPPDGVITVKKHCHKLDLDDEWPIPVFDYFSKGGIYPKSCWLKGGKLGCEVEEGTLLAKGSAVSLNSQHHGGQLSCSVVADSEWGLIPVCAWTELVYLFDNNVDAPRVVICDKLVDQRERKEGSLPPAPYLLMKVTEGAEFLSDPEKPHLAAVEVKDADGWANFQKGEEEAPSALGCTELMAEVLLNASSHLYYDPLADPDAGSHVGVLPGCSFSGSVPNAKPIFSLEGLVGDIMADGPGAKMICTEASESEIFIGRKPIFGNILKTAEDADIKAEASVGMIDPFSWVSEQKLIMKLVAWCSTNQNVIFFSGCRFGQNKELLDFLNTKTKGKTLWIALTVKAANGFAAYQQEGLRMQVSPTSDPGTVAHYPPVAPAPYNMIAFQPPISLDRLALILKVCSKRIGKYRKFGQFNTIRSYEQGINATEATEQCIKEFLGVFTSFHNHWEHIPNECTPKQNEENKPKKGDPTPAENLHWAQLLCNVSCFSFGFKAAAGEDGVGRGDKAGAGIEGKMDLIDPQFLRHFTLQGRWDKFQLPSRSRQYKGRKYRMTIRGEEQACFEWGQAAYNCTSKEGVKAAKDWMGLRGAQEAEYIVPNKAK